MLAAATVTPELVLESERVQLLYLEHLIYGLLELHSPLERPISTDGITNTLGSRKLWECHWDSVESATCGELKLSGLG